MRFDQVDWDEETLQSGTIAVARIGTWVTAAVVAGPGYMSLRT